MQRESCTRTAFIFLGLGMLNPVNHWTLDCGILSHTERSLWLYLQHLTRLLHQKWTIFLISVDPHHFHKFGFSGSGWQLGQDLKLENIMLASVDPPEAVVIDVGLAELFPVSEADSFRSADPAGTLATMAPVPWRMGWETGGCHPKAEPQQ